MSQLVDTEPLLAISFKNVIFVSLHYHYLLYLVVILRYGIKNSKCLEEDEIHIDTSPFSGLGQEETKLDVRHSFVNMLY